MPDTAARMSAFAQALGLTITHLLALLESYDLCLLDGKAGPEYPGLLRQIDGSKRPEGQCEWRDHWGIRCVFRKGHTVDHAPELIDGDET